MKHQPLTPHRPSSIFCRVSSDKHCTHFFQHINTVHYRSEEEVVLLDWRHVPSRGNGTCELISRPVIEPVAAPQVWGIPLVKPCRTVSVFSALFSSNESHRWREFPVLYIFTAHLVGTPSLLIVITHHNLLLLATSQEWISVWRHQNTVCLCSRKCSCLVIIMWPRHAGLSKVWQCVSYLWDGEIWSRRTRWRNRCWEREKVREKQ